VKPTQRICKTPDPLADLLASFDDLDLDALLAELAEFDIDDILAGWTDDDPAALLGAMDIPK